jgi:hypothetical protein
MNTFSFASFALATGKSVRRSTEPFRIKSPMDSKGTISFPIGTFISQFDKELLNIAEELGLEPKVSAHFPNTNTILLQKPRIALFADAGSPFLFASILSKAGMNYYPISALEIRRNCIDNYDVLIIPGGGDGGPAAQAEILGERGKQAVKNFVKRGGGVWGSCAGCINIIRVPRTAWKPSTEIREWSSIGGMELINAEYWSSGYSGVGKLLMENLFPTHPVMFGLPTLFEMTWHLGPLMTRAKSRLYWASQATPLLKVKGFTKHWTAAEYVYALEKQFEEGALDRTYAGRGIKEGGFGLMIGRYGSGRVCASGGHPEFGMDPLLEKCGEPAKILLNFILWSTSSNSQNLFETPVKMQLTTNYRSDPVIEKRLFSLVSEKTDELSMELKTLVDKSSGFPYEWFAENNFPSTFGLTGTEKWPSIIKRLVELPSEIARENKSVYRLVFRARKTLMQHNREHLNTIMRHEDSLSEVDQAENELWKQFQLIHDDYIYDRDGVDRVRDYGWQGVLGLLESALDKIKTITRTDCSFKKKINLYSAICDWYLGALYDMLNALTVLQARRTLIIRALRLARASCANFEHSDTHNIDVNQ